MKILAIRGRNLASLEGDFEIDFTQEPLLSTGIFAISGPTGAGKSTLLDAMCLALFARTPRTNQARENSIKLKDVNNEQLPQSDPRFLLRRGTAAGHAEVDFVALNGMHYRARWSVSRAHNKESGRLQQPVITLFNLDKSVEEQGTRTDLQARILELIGLTFEQFTRSVLLAQNDFSTFLKAEQSEKAALLEKLTGTEIYSVISRKVFERNSAMKEQYETVRKQVQGIELLPEAELLALQQEAEKQALQKKQLEEAKATAQQLTDQLQQTEKQIQQKQQLQQQGEADLKRAMVLFEAATKESQATQQRCLEAEARLKAMQPELQGARKLDLELQAQTEEAKKRTAEWELAVRRSKEGKTLLDKLQQACQSLRTQQATLGKWLDDRRAKAGIAEQQTTLDLLLNKAGEARIGVEACQKALNASAQTAEKLLQRQATELQKQKEQETQTEQTRKAAQSLEEQLRQLDMAALDAQLESTRTRREELMLIFAKDVSALRARLIADQPCPVCGSASHPFSVASAMPHSDAIDQLTQQMDALKAKRKQYEADRLRYQQLQQLLNQQLQALAEMTASASKLRSEMELNQTRADHDKSRMKQLSEQQVEAMQGVDQLFGNDNWQKAWGNDPVDFRKKLQQFIQEWQQKSAEWLALAPQLSAEQARCQSQEALIPGLLQEVEMRNNQLTALKQQQQAMQAERSKLLNGQPADVVEATENRQLEALRKQLQQLSEQQTQQGAAVARLKGMEEQLAKDLAALQQEIGQRRSALVAWEQDFLPQLGDQSLTDALQVAVGRFTELQYQLRKQEENRKQMTGLQQELEAKQAESERWARLNELIGSADGARFRRIAQGYTLDLLIHYANVQLRNLTRRYQLERVPDTLALQVVDHDMCDEIRSVHSLSGGESFLVSLALALGLSALSSNRMKVESLFIDEGFGSLDAETLRVAMDALENLRTQGRKIGVISHVQEMTERIPVQIRIERAGNGRSSLEIRG